jgi:uncharacterized membrane protein (DUF2068 family)
MSLQDPTHALDLRASHVSAPRKNIATNHACKASHLDSSQVSSVVHRAATHLSARYTDRVKSAAHRRELGLRLIITYKFVKAPIMLILALWLTFAPGAAYRSLDALAHELAEGGVAWARAGAWFQENLTHRAVTGGAVLAWLDSTSTAIEGFLLLSGKSWAQWTVAAGLACLLPLELLSLDHRPSATKLMVLIANAVIVIYLVRRRGLAGRC